ncbi:DUF192 domain-containing protein [Sphingomonas sp. PAMC 26617]|uniref:DUF192 domain-containing protein n=1 Tax=Sphingomonas sp. PAMC 26617 TaxID=1112216 RepID=UPI0002892717|nr:DUF192 domain-containing protein [Sphingomonas sp. PAMC 26617]
MRHHLANAVCIALLTATAGCDRGVQADAAQTLAEGMVAVTIKSATGAHRFQVESTRTQDEQRRGLMFRTDIPRDGGMLFAPYPPSGPPQPASFWMKDTPTPLDIIFIRPDRTIARIAENTPPQSEIPVASGEPVSAVLELRGGRSLELGIKEGDSVSWSAAPTR